ncbi:Aste57867_19406 [Aphanomyces stellatus]|uniref:Aste57867_19406 protein n=1 Tax=Aphanomyces stellatus TaxID=120398 RepID=A0A485LCQ5_9STRA|nr:hypothetical protein As57867_019342 [Aphanomyces stellatus]VFT96120.1 Aste57867_19406 [Aphanomyces stellatus]
MSSPHEEPIDGEGPAPEEQVVEQAPPTATSHLESEEEYEDESEEEEEDENGHSITVPTATPEDEAAAVAPTTLLLRQRSHLQSEAEIEENPEEYLTYGGAHPDLVKLHTGYVPWTDSVLKEYEANKDKGLVDTDVSANRLSGVIYAQRFWVTLAGWGLGFGSKPKLLVLSPLNLFALDPSNEQTTDTWAYSDIVEVISNDALSFTIVAKNNQRSTYICKDKETRNQFLSSYYQLYYRDRPDDKDQAATLFQTPTYVMKKRSKSKGTSSSPVDTLVLLEVRRASLDRYVVFSMQQNAHSVVPLRLDPKTKKPISSVSLTNILKIQKLQNDPHGLVIFYQQDKSNITAQRYTCEEREAFIGVVINNLRTIVKDPLLVQEEPDAADYDALVHPSDPVSVMFEMPVQRRSKTTREKLVHLALTRTDILERDAVTHRTLARFSLSDVFNIVISTEETEKFSIELKNGRTRRYTCVSSVAATRSPQVGLGLEQVTDARLKELQAAVMDPTFTSHPSFKSAGSTTLLTPTASRNLWLSNVFEVFHKIKKHVTWSTEETPLACKVGGWSSECNSDWEEILLKKLQYTWKSSHDNQAHFDQLFRFLEQFNKNIPVGAVTSKNVTKPLACLLKVVEQMREYISLKIKDPSSNSHAAIPSPALQVALLLAIQRLLHTSFGFQEVLRKDYRKVILIVMEFLYSPVAEVGFAAAQVLNCMVVNYSSDKNSLKMELANRRAVFHTEKRSAMFVNRVFDPAAQSSNVFSLDAVPNPLMNRVLSATLVGLDYLVLSSVLATMETCLASGKRSTPEKVHRDLLNSMRIDDFAHHNTLFTLNRSLSFPVTKFSSIMVKVHVLEQPSELVEQIQDFARTQGALLWQLYLSVGGHDQSQRRISSQLVALLTHENPRSSNLIRNIFPHGLIGDVPPEKCSYDEFGRRLPFLNIVPTVGPAPAPLSNVPDLQARLNAAAAGADKLTATVLESQSVRTTSPATAEDTKQNDKVHSGVTSRSQVVATSKCVVLLPDFFDKLRGVIVQKDLRWDASNLAELQQRLIDEISTFDLNRLTYFFFHVSNPTERVESALDASMDGVHRDLEALSGQFPTMFSGTDLPIAAYDPFDKEDDETVDPHGGHGSTAAAGTRVETPKPFWFLNWNADEFVVEFACLQKEVRVGAYYLKALFNSQGELVEDIVDAEPFINLLYFRVLATDDEAVRLLCLKAMTALYNKYATDIRSLVFLNHFLREAMQRMSWSLRLRGHAMLFVERVLSNAVNVARFLHEPRNLELVLDLLKEVKPLEDDAEATSIAQTCLLVLMKLVHSQTTEQDELLKTEYFFGDQVTSTSAVGPVSAIKRALSVHLKFLVSLLDHPNRNVFRKCIHLFHLLVQNNESMVPSLHTTGLFYYLFRNTHTEDDMYLVGNFLTGVHLRQRPLHMSPEELTKLLDHPAGDDAFTQRCLKSWLIKILPVSLVAQLVRHGSKKFASVYFGTSNDPETLWSDSMRQQMLAQVDDFITSHHQDGEFTLAASEDDTSTPLVTYPEEVYALQCYQYYLHNLLDEAQFPNWPINDPAAFLRALMESVRVWVYPTNHSKISGKDIVLVFNAISLIFRRFWTSLEARLHEYLNFQMLLLALKKCNDMATPQWDIFLSALEVITTACQSSDIINTLKDTTVVSGLRVLYDALVLAHAHRATDLKPTRYLLESFKRVVNQPLGRDGLSMTPSLSILPFLIPYLELTTPSQDLTGLALQILTGMALGSGKSDDLLDAMAKRGIVWYLAPIICTNPPGQGLNTRQLAAEALKGILRPENAPAPSARGRMQRTIDQIFTRPLIDLLLSQSDPEMFLRVVAHDVKKPHMMWTASMRAQLLALADEAHESASEFTLPSHFMYDAQQMELRVADIYVNFYNADPESGITALISSGLADERTGRGTYVTDQTEIRKRVMANLLSALSHDIAGVRARPEILESVLNERMLPVVTAVRHMLQYTPEMDMQLVDVDGIVTLFAGLDHDETKIRFSTEKAPYFQLRVMECLHIAMFSPKCIEKIAEKIPLYVKSMFAVVYNHLPKRKESDEGQLARVALQLLGNLCLVPTCIDKLVSGMDAAALAKTLPLMSAGNNHQDVELLLNIHTTALKRHTNLSIAFAKSTAMPVMATALLNLLSAPDAIAGNTKAPIARFLNVLWIIPGNLVSAPLRDSRVWKEYTATHATASTRGEDASADVKKWLVLPVAPALLKFKYANPQKIGLLMT